MTNLPMSIAAVAASAWLGSIVLAQPPPDYKGDCTDAGCHDAYGRKAVVHDPVSTDSCDACHEEKDPAGHKFEFAEEGAGLCEACHDEHSGKVRHSPVADGECTACHDPHASDAKNLLVAATEVQLCGECHEDVTEDLAYLHGPVAAGACTVCHDPHASEHATLLLHSDKDVCVRCHTEIQTRITEKVVKHDPATEECLACHSPHGADNRMNLREKSPDLCLDCHDGIADVMDEAAVTHDALTAGRACVSCHTPHASDVEHLLSSGPMDLCLTCHNKALTAGKRKLVDIKKLLAENPVRHGPIQQKSCTGCHNVHGGEHFRLLIEEYPSGFYSPYEEKRYALCFACHEPDMVQDAETNKLTDFRNGKQNLHYVHVHRSVKGRTCRSCHNTHASRRPKHITETVPFGEWNLPVNFEKTDTGGSCRPGCHRLYRYDRQSAVANLPD
ncbi:MAG: hypothetical protein JSU86_18340 [Phycisphaerales bacterium]|nr:MAG: hypothetical protein JSU86_18340 [Phycisphaerales bacterium]